jgi:hypothetical protein
LIENVIIISGGAIFAYIIVLIIESPVNAGYSKSIPGVLDAR